MPHQKRTTIKSERHAELARRSIDGRSRGAGGRWLPRTPAVGDPPPPPPAPALDPQPRRPRRDPATFRVRA